MALVASIHVEPGWKMPAVQLQKPEGGNVALADCAGANGLLVAFTCNHCPYAIAVWPRLIKQAKILRDMGVNTVAVNPNIHPDYPQDSMPVMLEKIAEWGIDFPYLADESQDVSRVFDAQCTPDLYLFDKDGRLYYHGRIDDNWKDEEKVKQQELIPAVEALLAGKPAPQPQHPTIGCSIKWKD
ncbi:MAG: thioredoxin family protein [Zetaproteobacteria bacterium CG12_big_fil_rev_8_21_14_0_65_55_1124]|nr:MAG: thioredoxin family protein [Zetaproteobacteria bacterium CG1_02_55_237]PIS20441.1 MAG: thioredoxin family protein [Zetaproteobacteria bacterium CG08_land_8_20_14_0_20_55_17]PIW41876.1 MAG: thioredoxin family protein [Zetaproteobacteria bacterium CG12_big_fil_rev_8_21_14_0_65_55_1124]PIY51421.1 MAG: thioredoxin family protein [Zetaproteobacteria bacterium CG_4_10_14_0_8_um_filter_55_43]PIZ36860.1 MAG: thioredoxin family protein [Zetaproteobacteria bacterium CG_4_10_14_0_2_um_filter_55_20